MASVLYNSFKKEVSTAINLATDTIKVMLVSSAYTPDIDTHTRRSDITNEVGASGSYASGGSALANQTWTQDNINDRSVFDADDVAWTSATITARGAVIYKANGGAASADELIAYIDFGSDKTSTAGTFTITWDASGILTNS